MKILIEEQVLQQALDALHRGRQQIIGVLVQQDQDQAITALSTALDAAEGVNPVAWFCEDESTLSFAKMRGCDCIPLYPAPAVPEGTM